MSLFKEECIIDIEAFHSQFGAITALRSKNRQNISRLIEIIANDGAIIKKEEKLSTLGACQAFSPNLQKILLGLTVNRIRAYTKKYRID